MRKYLQVSFQTLTGIKTFIDLGDFSYGEWIIYDNEVPKYHIVTTDTASSSNSRIKLLISAGMETIESILRRINSKNNTRLSLGEKPFIEIVKKEELIELDLPPLPDHWLENI